MRPIAISSNFELQAWDEQAVQVWIHQSNREQALRAGRHVSTIVHGRFLHGDRILATSGFDSVVRLWDAATGEAIAGPLPHGNRSLRLKANPNGNILLSHSSDHLIRLWDISALPLSPEEMGQIASKVVGHHLGVQGELLPIDRDSANFSWDPSSLRPQAPSRHQVE